MDLKVVIVSDEILEDRGVEEANSPRRQETNVMPFRPNGSGRDGTPSRPPEGVTR